MRILIISLIFLILGMVVPFVDGLVFIEIFFLTLPLTTLFFGLIAMFIGNLIWDRSNLKRSSQALMVVGLFIGGHYLSTWTVSHIQRFRSENAIKDIETIVAISNRMPDHYQIKYGIKYLKLDKDQFEIKYGRGNLMTEVYYSSDKRWRSIGWND